MTHVAAATAAPHVSRRRPFGPAAWERVGAAFGAVGAIGITMLALAGALLATATLLADRSTAEEAVFAWFLVALWVVALAATILRGDHSLSEEGS